MLQPRASLRGVTWVIRRIELHRGANLGALFDVDRNHVEDHAAEIEKSTAAQCDVVAVVTVKRRPDDCSIPYTSQSLT